MHVFFYTLHTHIREVANSCFDLDVYVEQEKWKSRV